MAKNLLNSVSGLGKKVNNISSVGGLVWTSQPKTRGLGNPTNTIPTKTITNKKGSRKTMYPKG